MNKTCIKISSGEEFSSLSEVFASKSFRGGDTITFLTDVTVDKPIVIDKKCFIDLDDHFLFVPFSQAITVKNGVTVEVYNGKIQTLSPEPVEDALVVQGTRTTVKFRAGLQVDTHGTAVHVRRRGNFIIEDGSVRSTGDQPTIYVEDEDSRITLNHGTVASYEKNAIVARNKGTIVINDGEVYTESNGLVPETSHPAIIVCGQSSYLQVNNGSIFSCCTPAISVQASGSAFVYGGTVYSNSNDFTAVEVLEANSSFELVDGWIYSSKTSAILSAQMGYNDVHTIQVTGGKVGAVGDVVNVGGPGDHNILFSAGLIKGHLSPDQIAVGYVVSDIPDADGYAPIILKTWVDNDDILTEFPKANESTISDGDNPFDPVSDPDVPEVLPFPPASIAGTPVTTYTDDIILSTIEHPVPLPQPPINGFAPPDIPTVPVVPVPVPDGVCEPVGPLPQPGPTPGYAPGPQQDEVDNTIFNSSVNIRHTIYIYKTPSRKTKMAEWRGALRVLDGGYFGPDRNEEFAMVKFRIPGCGQTSTGYALVYDLSHP